MLLHCIASVLLQGPGTSFPSLSHVIPHSSASTSPKAFVPGYLSYLTSQHVEIFLSALDLSYVAALKFDCRPGLKFLVQKVANLQQPANLYRQAGAAWTIKFITLFELCLREIEETKANLDTVKLILCTSYDIKDIHDTDHQKLTRYLRQLRTTFDELCESYVEVVLDEDGRHTRVDSFSERKIFLLVAQPDDYPEITRKEPINDRVAATPAPMELPQDLEDQEAQELKDQEAEREEDPAVDQEEDHDEDQEDPEEYNPNLDDESGLEELGPEDDDDPRPFRLSDLAAEYSTDSEPQSEPETDDSRPVSRLGSVTEKIVYPDRSGGTSSEGYIDGKFDSITPAPAELINNQDNLYYNLGSLWKTESVDSFGTSILEVKIPNTSMTFDEISSYQKSRLQRRRSEACLLTRRNSLKFMLPSDLEDLEKSPRFDAGSFRCRSVMELRKARGSTVSSSSNDLDLSPRATSKMDDKEECKASRLLDNIDELLRDYERSKRGFRTNPFLRDDGDDSSIESQETQQEIELQRKSNVNKDSEAHRKAWAETLSTALDWALALPDDRLAPLLPVLVTGVRILTRHAVDQILKQRLSTLFHRIAVLYGLTSN